MDQESHLNFNISELNLENSQVNENNLNFFLPLN